MLFLTDDSGEVVTGRSSCPTRWAATWPMSPPAPTGVALPTLAAITAGTTAGQARQHRNRRRGERAQGRDRRRLGRPSDGATYTVASPIVINITSSTQGPVGIDLGGAKIVSQIAKARRSSRSSSAPGVDLGGLTLSNFSILGNGREGDGIKIVADGADRSVQTSTSATSTSSMSAASGSTYWAMSAARCSIRGCTATPRAAHASPTAPAAAWSRNLEWIGGGVRKNGVAGLILDNGAHDLSVTGAYFVDNDGPGIMAPAGITTVPTSGFENNLGTGAIVGGTASFTDDTFSTWGRQVGIGGYLEGGRSR